MGIDYSVYKQSDFLANRKLDKLIDNGEITWEEYSQKSKKSRVYIRESYHGCTHAVCIFDPGSYDSALDGQPLDWRKLLPRMPEVAKACMQRELDYLAKTTNGGWERTDELDEAKVLNPKEKLDYGIGQLELFLKVIRLCISEERKGRKVVSWNSY